MNLLVAYDISTETKAGEKRLRRVARLCVAHGHRVQDSVFECRLDEVTFVEFVRQLSEVIHPIEDNLRIYRVSDFGPGKVVNLGKQVGVDYDAPMIL
ncbi:CRISPR-associated endonuclease Cas2 [Alicyclobacillus cycloheptanicus]|uniref:CRISPR-associated endoribonuclease Cas2 n=1 Tax=Alicyclobacillus cycloheptanicus TaxID=1457 RepID=A0ABT9XH79_9BACL|nr:CRISPR-associated protein Cas2 [Alicyclobacillus cycloheptanicus]WDL99946.1 CRISPR-associated endonuclease Cas2 [Alicyclobacillus cycloheptanicus]